MSSSRNFTESLSMQGNNMKIEDTHAEVTDVCSTEKLSELTIVTEGEERTSWFVWLLVLCCSILGLLFCYDTGVISGALVTIRSDLGPESLSSQQKEFITSETTLGALIGGLVAGALADYIGRKPVLGIADVIFVGGPIGQAVIVAGTKESAEEGAQRRKRSRRGGYRGDGVI